MGCGNCSRTYLPWIALSADSSLVRPPQSMLWPFVAVSLTSVHVARIVSLGCVPDRAGQRFSVYNSHRARPTALAQKRLGVYDVRHHTRNMVGLFPPPCVTIKVSHYPACSRAFHRTSKAQHTLRPELSHSCCVCGESDWSWCQDTVTLRTSCCCRFLTQIATPKGVRGGSLMSPNFPRCELTRALSRQL